MLSPVVVIPIYRLLFLLVFAFYLDAIHRTYDIDSVTADNWRAASLTLVRRDQLAHFISFGLPLSRRSTADGIFIYIFFPHDFLLHLIASDLILFVRNSQSSLCRVSFLADSETEL